MNVIPKVYQVNAHRILKNAPHDATHYTGDNDFYYASYYKDGGKLTWNVDIQDNSGWVEVCEDDMYAAEIDLADLVKQQESEMNIDDIAKEDGVTLKPVYTQAMCDAEELPPIGMKLEFNSNDITGSGIVSRWQNGDVIEVIAHKTMPHCGCNELSAVYWNENKEEASTVRGDLVRLIDNRTTEEKQLDHVVSIVGSMSHLPAVDTGRAIIQYLKDGE